MKKSTRFSGAVHVMTMLAAKPDEFLSSDVIATSMGTNRVVVLRLVALLTQAELVESKTGKQGGARLAQAANKITLLDIYHAVEANSLFQYHSPHPNCVGGKFLTRDLENILTDAESLLEKRLAARTLASSMKAGIQAMKKYLDKQ